MLLVVASVYLPFLFSSFSQFVSQGTYGSAEDNFGCYNWEVLLTSIG